VTQTAVDVVDVTLNAPGHATVHTSETWAGEIDSANTGQRIALIPSTTYVETYTVEFQDGGWIVILNEVGH
jgi:hypothetical protein